MPTLNVDLGERSYPIYIETGLFNQAGFLLSAIQGKQCAIVTNETVAPLFLNSIKKPLSEAGISAFDIILPDGAHGTMEVQHEHISGEHPLERLR